jgi:2,3-dihydroxybiphenyl 1,2-dioxygenase
VSPLGNGFMTGSQGLGHALLLSDRCTDAVGFYEGLLGFQMRESKTAPDGTVRVAFLSPNEREHCVALVASPDGSSRIGHVLIEVTELDAVGRAMDRCVDGLAPMTVSLGRHTNDEMVSFYLRTPSGFDIEFGCGGKVVNPERWSRGEVGGSGLTSLWGHRRLNPDGTLGLQLGRPPSPAR